jgi:autoinducer 2-degrading protein
MNIIMNTDIYGILTSFVIDGQIKVKIWYYHLTLPEIPEIMIVTCVYVHVKSESLDAFIKASIANHILSVKEPGNLRFDFVQQADDQNRFMIYEAYDSDDAATAHKNTPHYLRWRDEVQNMMAEPRRGVKYNILQPARIVK